MKTTYIATRLVIALAASAVLVVPASAEEQYKRISVEELKQAQKKQDAKDKELWATPEYQEKKRQEAEERKLREEEKRLAWEKEMQAKKEAAELKRLELEAVLLQKQIAMAESGGSAGDVGGSQFDPSAIDPPMPSGRRIAVVWPVPRRPIVSNPTPRPRPGTMNVGGLKITPSVRIAPGVQTAGMVRR